MLIVNSNSEPLVMRSNVKVAIATTAELSEQVSVDAASDVLNVSLYRVVSEKSECSVSHVESFGHELDEALQWNLVEDLLSQAGEECLFSDGTK